MGAVARLLREQDEEIDRLTARVAELEAEVARLRGAVARIQVLSHQAWCDMQGRLTDSEHKRAHAALARINGDASATLAGKVTP